MSQRCDFGLAAEPNAWSAGYQGLHSVCSKLHLSLQAARLHDPDVVFNALVDAVTPCAHAASFTQHHLMLPSCNILSSQQLNLILLNGRACSLRHSYSLTLTSGSAIHYIISLVRHQRILSALYCCFYFLQNLQPASIPNKYRAHAGLHER